MKAQTELAIRKLLSLDGEIPQDDIERATSILSGCPDRHEDLVHVLRYKDVMKMLKITREGLKYYIRKGYLVRVFGSGSRAIGISQDSYQRFTQRRVETSNANAKGIK